MDEKEKDKIVETTEMSKAEILEKSRNENKGGDERDRLAFMRGAQVAFAVAMLLIGVVEIVLACVDKFLIEPVLIFSGIAGAYNTVLGASKIKNHKVLLVCGITLDIMCVLFIVLWALELSGYLV